MDKLHRKDIEQVLGIYKPWSIAQIKVDQAHGRLTLQLEMESDKPRFSFLSSATSIKDPVNCQWQHIKLGRYHTYVEATIDRSRKQDIAFRQPMFLGEIEQPYSRELAHQVNSAFRHNLNEQGITALLGIESSLVKTILRDQQDAPDQQMSIPAEGDEVWRRLLFSQQDIHTDIVAFKFLLSRLQKSVADPEANEDVVNRSLSELRSFFVQNQKVLSGVLSQLGVKTQKEVVQPASKQAAQRKLILPGLQNAFWPQLLSGEESIESSNIAFNLLLARSKKQWAQTTTTLERHQVIRELQQFLKMNARQLIAELTQITESVRANTEVPLNQLPDAEHPLWARILEDSSLIKSDKINFNLFYSRQKLVYARVKGNDAEFSVRRQLSEFFHSNQATLREEIAQLQQLQLSESA